MKVLFIILLVLVVVLSIFVSIVENKTTKIAEDKRKEFLSKCTEEQQALLNAYRKATQTDIYEVFKKRKKDRK